MEFDETIKTVGELKKLLENIPDDATTETCFEGDLKLSICSKNIGGKVNMLIFQDTYDVTGGE